MTLLTTDLRPYLSSTNTTGVGSSFVTRSVKMKDRKDCMTNTIWLKYSEGKCFSQPKNMTLYACGMARMPDTTRCRATWKEAGRSSRGFSSTIRKTDRFSGSSKGPSIN